MLLIETGFATAERRIEKRLLRPSAGTSTVPANNVLQTVDHGTCAKSPANRAAKKATPAVTDADTVAVVMTPESLVANPTSRPMPRSQTFVVVGHEPNPRSNLSEGTTWRFADRTLSVLRISGRFVYEALRTGRWNWLTSFGNLEFTY
jgi:hypothetical protein